MSRADIYEMALVVLAELDRIDKIFDGAFGSDQSTGDI